MVEERYDLIKALGIVSDLLTNIEFEIKNKDINFEVDEETYHKLFNYFHNNQNVPLKTPKKLFSVKVDNIILNIKSV